MYTVTPIEVIEYTNMGTLVTRWEGSGGDSGYFECLVDVAVGPGGYVYVADNCASRIQKFTSTGTYLTQGKPGQWPGPVHVSWGHRRGR